MTRGLDDELGCDFGQGFFFARPLPAEGLDALLAARSADSPGRTHRALAGRAV
ncbi:MAG: hypothetical protein H0T39_09245 [Actinobacteria bacterium]|nr:hypothetical protein [Actinomycetota bacterium]